MNADRVTVAGISLPLTGPATSEGPASAPPPANPERKPMEHTTGQPAGPGTAQVSLGGFRVRTDPHPSRPTPPAPPAPTARAGLRLVSSTANPHTPKPQLGTEGPWRYWVSVAFTDGHTGATMELSRMAPIITSDDRAAVADVIATHLQRPVASLNYLTPLSRPNPITGRPEPDIPPSAATSPAGDAQPWRYRVNYATDTGRGTCEVDRSGPIRGQDDVQALRAAIAEQTGRRVTAVESFSVLGAPAQSAPGSAGAR